jgi:hypothetical protein
LELDLPIPDLGEARRRNLREIEAAAATTASESPASTEQLMEVICSPDNIEVALQSVVRNKGAPGIDGITVKQLPGILKARWREIEEQLLQGRYQPQPVRRVQIPKPDGGGVRHMLRARKRKGFGWTRWSRQWLYESLRLFNGYRVRRPLPKVAPAR